MYEDNYELVYQFPSFCLVSTILQQFSSNMGTVCLAFKSGL